MNRTRLAAMALPAALGLLVPSAPRAQDAGSDDFARRTFANAEQLMREGKPEQALKDFAQVASAYADSRLADDALYRIGSHHYPAEGVEGLGRAGREGLTKARDAFLKIRTSYPQGDRAPDALWKLGLIAIDPDNPQPDPDEAYASFTAVVNIHPASGAVGKALFGAGYVDFTAGRHDKAIRWFEQAAELHPDDPAAAPAARYHLALALMRQGAWARACEELQRLRDAWPKGEYATRALDLASQIQKLRLPRPAGSPPLFVLDVAFKPALPAEFGRGGVALAVDGSSTLHLLDTRSGVIQPIGHDGKPAPPITDSPIPGASGLWIDRPGELILSAGDRFRAGRDMVVPMRTRSGKLEPIEGIAAAVRIGPRRIAFLDGGASEILVHTGNPAQPVLLYADPQRKVRLAGLALGAGGRLYTIDRRGRKILEIAPDGSAREVPVEAEAAAALADPIAIATDDLGDLYVLDRRNDLVMVLTPEGRTLQVIRSIAGGAAEFTEPGAIAVGPRGEIYVHDERRRATLRFW